MAFFGVTVETIAGVYPHPNADRLERVELAGLGYPLVVPKGRHRAGEQVLYFPIDALIPADLADRMGVRNYLSGPERDRVKTAVLRGEPSQGIAAPLDLLAGIPADASPEQITAGLRVTKYAPPLKPIVGGQLLPLPDGLTVYDIEAAERQSALFNWLRPREVVVLEKIEGCNLATSLSREGKITYCQRENSIAMDEGARNDYVDAAEADYLPSFLDYLRYHVNFRHQLTVYAELVGPGVRHNYYKVPTHRACVFDVKIDTKWLPWAKVLSMADGFRVSYGKEVPLVPTLFMGKLDTFLAGRSLRAASNGFTKLDLPLLPKHSRTGLLQEGIVVRDAAEECMPDTFNRSILKQRDPLYLSKTDN